MNSEEQAFYESILKEFDDVFPPKPPEFNFNNADSKTFIKKHISGFKSQKTTYKGKTTFFTYEKDSSNHVFCRPDIDCYGEGSLVQEFKTFLNGALPTEEKFAEFIHQKEINYVKSNWQTLYAKNFRKEAEYQAMDKAIKDSEDLYRRCKKDDLERLWHPYPTQRFYRIVDKNELAKMLRGEEIISRYKTNGGYDRIDISSDPYYNRISRLGKFRIEFRGVNYDGSGNASLASRIGILKPEYQHYQIHGSYDRSDVLLDRIKAWNGEDWIPVRIVEK